MITLIAYSSDGHLVLYLKDRKYSADNVQAGVYYRLEALVKNKNWKAAFALVRELNLIPQQICMLDTTPSEDERNLIHEMYEWERQSAYMKGLHDKT